MRYKLYNMFIDKFSVTYKVTEKNKIKILTMRHSYLFIIAIMLAVMTPRIAPAQSIAVKSNVLYDLTGTLNLGGEIRCDDTHSFNLSVNYNPWNLGENKK